MRRGTCGWGARRAPGEQIVQKDAVENRCIDRQKEHGQSNRRDQMQSGRLRPPSTANMQAASLVVPVWSLRPSRVAAPPVRPHPECTGEREQQHDGQTRDLATPPASAMASPRPRRHERDGCPPSAAARRAAAVRLRPDPVHAASVRSGEPFQSGSAGVSFVASSGERTAEPSRRPSRNRRVLCCGGITEARETSTMVGSDGAHARYDRDRRATPAGRRRSV
jgi:hypothetical protein